MMTAAAPLRACLLSGGASRRMGTDKALLPHPDGATWLERTLLLLAGLQIPVVLFSRHPQHLELGHALNRSLASGNAGTPSPSAPAYAVRACSTNEESAGAAFAAEVLEPGDAPPGPMPITPLLEPEPWEGPLLALHRLMQHHPQHRLLLCPVDMPLLNQEVLVELLAAAAREPERIHLAHDGQRCQPLLGIYPSDAATRQSLARTLATGERRLQHWLADQAVREVRLDPRALRNVNHREELPARH